MSGNPLASDGVVGKLKPEQEKALKEFWQEFFKLVDEAPEEGSGPKSKSDPSSGNEKEGGDIPKDDAAKEKMKAEEEMRNARAAFEEYGRKRFVETAWRFVAMDDPDMDMLRFLRARKWDTKRGVAMLCSCIKWRMDSDVEKIFEKGEEGMKDAEGFIKQMSMAKAYSQGTDHYGRPVVYIHVAKHRTFDQSPKALEDFVLFQMENVRCLLADRADKVTIVFDMTGFGIRNMDWRCILFIVKCLEAYYPESLNVMITHNAPWVFQGIWKVLSPMLDPVVRNKIQMTKNTDDLCTHIPKKHLIKQLGGDNSWEWKYQEIVPGENEKQKDKETRKKLEKERADLIGQYEEVTREWMKQDKPSEELVKKRKMLMHRMRAQYWELDPYIRGRGCYHRHGNIVGNGLVYFEYPNQSANNNADEWETIGYTSCREENMMRAEALARELGIEGDIAKKSGGGGEGDDGEGKKRKKKKSRA
ncbi:hypothetical protein OIO90_002265 [Microbotryomycetes sp. JL221]|nr:hypothetical protein OIO90_002265 [Microbotryomycetes sp. JL221]